MSAFPKRERLKQKRQFDALFSNGKRVFKFPVLALTQVTQNESGVPFQVGFSVPKKHFKKASERNLIKRRLSEAFRKHSDSLRGTLESSNQHLVICLVMMKTDNISYEELQGKIMLLLREIEDQIVHSK